ncbi:hypothetical protein GQ44DRAFT_705470 [Phaeosphaeriaceae sp. PMI808]|nr:hypothetical protein GQ44DRAFT_705470 [Phaeosphaeriaceae sp. PMI808]
MHIHCATVPTVLTILSLLEPTLADMGCKYQGWRYFPKNEGIELLRRMSSGYTQGPTVVGRNVDESVSYGSTKLCISTNDGTATQNSNENSVGISYLMNHCCPRGSNPECPPGWAGRGLENGSGGKWYVAVMHRDDSCYKWANS